jgi:hypothetical protein
MRFASMTRRHGFSVFVPPPDSVQRGSIRLPYLQRTQGAKLDLADCEVKSTWLRLPDLRKKESPFLAALSQGDLTRLAELYYTQLQEHHMRVFSVVVDKRKLHEHVDHHILHRKAYEFLLERIENYMREFHPKHNAVIVMDDTDKTINRGLAIKHAFFQREGNVNVDFRHILEYPFFTDSKLSNGIQLADLCGTTSIARSGTGNSSIRSSSGSCHSSISRSGRQRRNWMG